MHFISPLSVIPVRSEPSDKSELVTQLLFGETVTLQQTQRQWLQIKCAHDDYIGWIDQKQVLPIMPDEFTLLSQTPAVFAGSPIHKASVNGRQTYVLWGSVLPHFGKIQQQVGGYAYAYKGKVLAPNVMQPVLPKTLLAYSRKLLNAPYLWGGRSLFGIDCSGFTQLVFKAGGYALLRDAYQQATQGSPIANYKQLLPADLVFFHNPEGKIVHVGIYMGGSNIIHASGMVRIDRLTTAGIVNAQTGNITHNLAGIRRVAGVIV
ncbi:MAG TPA: C40 family peptidase [Chitinophagales bacterium]|nr:C40 family peptidase [Chitinophagales bacterium]HRK27313.1 C40 family peptidase [Chitinophagales bacterium]